MTELPPHPLCTIIRLTNTNTELLPDLITLYTAFAEHEGRTTPVVQFADFVIAQMEDETMLVLLASVEEQAVGYALSFDVAAHPFIPNGERTSYITNLFVTESHQQRGIGRALVDHTLDWLVPRKIPHMMLNVDVGNPLGEQFWRAQGFAPYLTRM